ncbi:hypothetical protein JS562_55755, partial [Agrobacterium sp. S2]|nr:hypothetical protein [Agrobacterium sp. S2]
MVTDFDAQAREFVGAYLTNGKSRALLAQRLTARGWRDSFRYLTSSDDVPDDVRVSLVDAALQGADTTHSYALDADVGEFIGRHYPDMPTFTAPQDDARIQMVATVLEGTGVLISDLAIVDATLKRQLVTKSLYQLTAPNLRAALDADDAVTLDNVLKSDVVYSYCFAEPARYLAAVKIDGKTPHTVEGQDTLRRVLGDVADSWSAGHVAE